MERIKLTVELKSGESHDLVISNPALVAFDRTRSARKWPASTEAPFLWMTFICWKQLTFQGLVSCSYDEFESDLCVGVGDTEEESQNEDPTQPTHELGSA